MILKNTDKKNVRIMMKTFQENEMFEHSYLGSFQIKNGKKYLIYNDDFEKCSVTSDGKIIRLTRFKSGTTMTFEQGAEHIGGYDTPMGRLALCVSTDAVSDKLCQNGTLTLEYKLSVGQTEPVNSKINITIEEIKNVSE